MAIEINLLTPTANARQVSTSTAISLEVEGTTSDGYGPDLSSLSVQINGVFAIRAGVFQQSSILFGPSSNALGPAPESSTRFYETLPDLFRIGDKVTVTDSIQSIQTTIIDIRSPLDKDGPTLIELKDALELEPIATRLPTYEISILNISRGYSGSLGSTTTINSLAPLPSNAVVFVVVEIDSLKPLNTIPDTAVITEPPQRTRKVFTFRTIDNTPPLLVDFPNVIHNSNLSFKIVDLLNNGINHTSIGVTLNDIPAIYNGLVQAPFMGSVTLDTDTSTAHIYLRPKQKFTHNQSVRAVIQAADIYSNIANHTRTLTNHSILPEVQFTGSSPSNDSTIDPTDSKLVIDLRVSEPLNVSFINVSYEVDGLTDPDTGSSRLPLIERGQFTNSDKFINTFGAQTGTILAGSQDVSIIINKLSAVTFNKKIRVFLTLQEVTDLGDIPVGSTPFYERTFTFTSLSARLSPIIDNFFPSSLAPVSISTQLRCRIRSQVQGAPINLNSIRVTIDGTTTAIDQGAFVGGWTGTIQAAQGSQGHTASIILNQPPGSTFTIGSTVTAQITASDIADNISTAEFAFTVVDTSAPTITITPPGGVFKQLTRIKIEADQASTIYYTIDGSKPEMGNISTFVQTSPINNVPIFKDGITQIKAFAVSAALVAGPITTAVFDLNPYAPVIHIVSPSQNTLLDMPSTAIDYNITLQRGFLTAVEVSVNNGPLQNVQNTLPQSSVSIAGLRTGANTIKLVATDNAGNVGSTELTVNVKASQIVDFGLRFAPVQCPEFTSRSLQSTGTLDDTPDTSTIAIIGLGSRTEVLVTFGLGDGADGLPSHFSTSNRPDGRHFATKSFPIQSHRLFLQRKGRTFQVPTRDYVLQPSSGQLVLDHPIEEGETLTIEYIAEPDINTPTLFTARQAAALYEKHGQPNHQNTLSLAAQIAFENGASRILAVQAADFVTDSTWFQSFKALENEEAYWIVPVVNNDNLSSYAAVLQTAFNHAQKMSNTYHRKERIVAGWRLPHTTNDFSSSRIFLASIDQNPTITRVINGETARLNGSFVAAAIAGYNSSLSISATPITGRSIVGFTLGTTKRSPKLDLDRELNQGFLPVQPLTTGASIYRGRTTYVGLSDPTREELSIQRTIDLISKDVRRFADNRFRGQLLTSTAIKNMKSEIQTFLSAYQSTTIAKGLVTDLQIDSQEPRQLNIAISITPLYPFNELSVSISVTTTI